MDHKAPFCSVGADCFHDVDHPRLATDIKRLAVAVAAYLKDRMVEEQDLQRRRMEQQGGQWDALGYHRHKVRYIYLL